MSQIAAIAQICHEANRAYCATIGDSGQLPWAEAPAWQRESAIKGVEFAQQGSTARSQHESWCADKRTAGWVYGPVKDVDAKTHPCLVDYDQLPVEQQKKDALFRAIVEALS